MRNKVAMNMFKAWYVPFYKFGVIHGDPHLGNYSICPNGDVNLMDFGCIRIFRPDFVTGVIELYKALRDNDEELGFLPNSHTEYVTFIAAFFYSDMWYKYSFDFIPFFFILFLLIITIWSRISIGCKTFKEAIFNVIFGALRGMIYFYFVSTYYNDAVKDSTVQNKCDLGYDNYQCNEIVDGTVIIKDTAKPKKETAAQKKQKVYEGWYD